MSYRSSVERIGEKGEKAVSKAVCSIAGVGGAGSVLADMLVREGFSVRLIDKGRIEEADVAHQSIYTAEDLSRFKAKQAKKRLELIRPESKVKAFHEQILPNNVYLLKADVVFDCTQNADLGVMIAAQCKQDRSPLIIVRSYGTTCEVLASTKAVTAKQLERLHVPNHAEEGILALTTRAAASIAMAEAYKILLGERKGSVLIRHDAWNGEQRLEDL